MAATTIHSLVYKVVADSTAFTKGIVATRSELSAAKKLFAETRTPIEKLDIGFAALDKLWEKGAITADTYTRAANRLTAELDQSTTASDDAAAAAAEHATALERGMRVTEEFATPLDRHARQLADLQSLLKSGAISEETFGRAAAKAASDMEKATGSAAALARIEKDVQTPLESHADRLAELDDLRKRGVISEGLYGRAVERAKQSLGGKVYDETRTGMERYEAEIAHLSGLLKAGAINQDTFNRAVKMATGKAAGSPFATAKKADPFAGIDQVLDRSPVGGAANFTKLVAGLGPAAIASGAALAGLAAGMAILKTTFDVIVPAVSRAMERIDATRKTADRLGVTTEALSGLRYAAEGAGVEASDFDGAMEKLNSTIGKAAREGNAGGEAFRRLGLDAKQLADERPDEAFLDVVDALGAIENPAQRAASAIEIFGKGNQRIINLALSGSEAIKAATKEAELFGQVIGDVDSRTIERTNDNLARIGKAVDGAANALAVELAPVIESVTELIVSQIKEWGGVKQAVADYVDFAVKDIALLIDTAAMLFPVLKSAGELLTGKELSGDAFLKGFDEMKKRSREASDAAAAQRDEQKGFADELGKSEALDAFMNKLSEQRAALSGEGDDFGFGKLKDIDLPSDKINEAAAALREFNDAKLAKEGSEEARRLEEAMQRELATLSGISSTKQKIADLDKRGVDTSRIKALDQELDREQRKKQLIEDTAKAREASEKESRSFVDALREKQKTPQQKLADNLDKLQLAISNGVVNAGETAGLEMQLARDVAGEDQRTTATQQAPPRTAGPALLRGTAEAFSAILRGANRGNDDSAKKTANNTEKTYNVAKDLLAETKKAMAAKPPLQVITY